MSLANTHLHSRKEKNTVVVADQHKSTPPSTNNRHQRRGDWYNKEITKWGADNFHGPLRSKVLKTNDDDLDMKLEIVSRL